MSPSVPLERSGPSFRAALAELTWEDLVEIEAEFHCALADDRFTWIGFRAVITRGWVGHLRNHPPTHEERAAVTRVVPGDDRGLPARTAPGG